MCFTCIVDQHVSVGNINIERVTMGMQQCILFSTVVELKRFCNNKMYLGLNIKYLKVLFNFNKIWSLLEDFNKSLLYKIL
jgi:hypothetical protein